MEPRTVGFESNDGRTLRLTVEGGCATARVGDSEPFPFNAEHLGYVGRGMGYQAWGNGSHMAFRCELNRVVVEFQGPHDRGVIHCRLSAEEFLGKIKALERRSSVALRISHA